MCIELLNTRSKIWRQPLTAHFRIILNRNIHFFLSGFSFTDADNSQDNRERKETIFIPIYHFQTRKNIKILICNFASEMNTAYFQSHRILLLDETEPSLGISWISILIRDVLTLDLITVCNLLQTRDGFVHRVHPRPPFCWGVGGRVE